MRRTDHAALYDKHWKSVRGVLTTLHGNIDEKPLQVIQFERVRERTKLESLLVFD